MSSLLPHQQPLTTALATTIWQQRSRHATVLHISSQPRLESSGLLLLFLLHSNCATVRLARSTKLLATASADCSACAALPPSAVTHQFHNPPRTYVFTGVHTHACMQLSQTHKPGAATRAAEATPPTSAHASTSVNNSRSQPTSQTQHKGDHQLSSPSLASQQYYGGPMLTPQQSSVPYWLGECHHARTIAFCAVTTCDNDPPRGQPTYTMHSTAVLSERQWHVRPLMICNQTSTASQPLTPKQLNTVHPT